MDLTDIKINVLKSLDSTHELRNLCMTSKDYNKVCQEHKPEILTSVLYNIHGSMDKVFETMVKKGYLKGAKYVFYLYKNQFNVNDIPELLTNACKIDDLEMMKYLVEKGLDIKSEPALLYTACNLGYLNIVKYLLKMGIDVNNYYINDGDEIDEMDRLSHCSPIEIASSNGFLEIVKLLVNYEADIYVNFGRPVFNSAINNRLNVFKYFISKDNAFLHNLDLRTVVSRGHSKILEYYFTEVKRVNSEIEKRYKVTKETDYEMRLIYFPFYDELLEYAYQCGYNYIVKILIDNGYTLNLNYNDIKRKLKVIGITENISDKSILLLAKYGTTFNVMSKNYDPDGSNAIRFNEHYMINGVIF
jgi:hypothetical protein